MSLTVKQRYSVRRHVRSLADRANLHGEPRDELMRLMLAWASNHEYEEFRKIRRVAETAADLHAWLSWQIGLCR